MDSKKILFVSQYAGFIGGLEIYIHAVSTLLRKCGFKTASMYVEKTRESEKFLAAFDESYPIEELYKISQKDFELTTLHKISNPEILEKILSRISPTVFVHDHDYFCPKGYKYYPYKRINCNRAFSPLFCGICASIVPPRHIKNGLAKMLEHNFVESARLCSLIKTCPRFVVLSDFMRRELSVNGIDENKIIKIHPFLKDEFFIGKNGTPPVPDCPNAVFAGQQVMSKGTPLFLEAMAKTKSGLKAEILGNGGRLEDFKKMSENMGLAEKVTFRGWVKNPNDYFSNATLSAFPSLWNEPFGLSAIEAMANAIPVVGFDVGGVSEWLRNGANGILVKPRDTSAFAEAMDTIATDSALRETMGRTAFEFVRENFSENKFIKKFDNLL